MSMSAAIFHQNRYCAEASCEHCGGVVRHESWCIIVNSLVYYAYQVVVEPSRLTLFDQLILHSLGVSWEAPSCAGKCKSETGSS